MPTREEIDAAKARLKNATPEQLLKIVAPPEASPRPQPEQQQATQPTQPTQQAPQPTATTSSGGVDRSAIEAAKERLKNKSPEELQALIMGKPPADDPSLLSQVGSVLYAPIEYAVDKLERYSAAPSRAALSELTRTTPEFGKNPPSFGGNVAASGSAFWNQLGQDPALAPTGEEIAIKRFGSDPTVKERVGLGAGSGFGLGGFADQVKNEGALATAQQPAGGLGTVMTSEAQDIAPLIEAGADISNVVPVGTILRGGGTVLKGAAKGTGYALKGSAKALRLDRPAKQLAESTKRAKEAIVKMIKPAQAKDFQDFVKIAKDNNLPDDIFTVEHEFGEASLITRLEKAQRQSPFGEELVNQFDEKLNKVKDAFENKVKELGNGTAPADIVEAGQKLKNDYDSALDRFFDSQEVTFNNIMRDFQGVLEISDDAQKTLKGQVAQMKDWAKRRAVKGATGAQRAQAADLLNTLKALEKNKNFDDHVIFLRDLGDAAFKNKNALVTNPPDIRKLRDLYFNVRDSLIETIRTDVVNGEKMAKDLIDANKAISDVLTEKSIVAKIVGDPTKAAEDVFKQATKNTRTIEALQAVLSPEEMASIKAAYLKSMLTPGKDGTWSFANLRNEFRRRESVINQLFEPEEVESLSDLIRFGDRFGISILNTSRTQELRGITDFLRNALDPLTQSVTNDQVRDFLKNAARGVKKEQAISPPPNTTVPKPQRGPLFGPRAISPYEAVGLRLPQQITRDQKQRDNKP